jgi:hypothetical protein
MMCFTFLLNAWAADPAGAQSHVKWNRNVESLERGTVIDVHLKIGVTGTGEFVGLEGKSIRIKDGNREMTFAQSSVSKIAVTKMGSRKANAIIAGIIAAPLSFGLGYALCAAALDKNSATVGERATRGGIAGGLLGGIAAVAVASREPGFKEKVIYRSR